MPGWKTPYDVPDTAAGIVWRNNVGAYRKGRSFIQYGVNGMPDILGMTKGGLFVGCEVKTAEGKVSDVQRWFLLLALRLGGYCFVARSYDECDSWLKEAGL